MILSICIPSYDRFEKLKETVENILKAKSDEFEVVIVDNCSPKNIYDYISFDDHRLKIIKRDTHVCGERSVGDSILYGRGEYSLLLLDKDTIIGEKLDFFIEALKSNNVMGGYCKINSNENTIEIVEKNTIKRFGYLSNHPSGNFYKIDEVREYINSKALYLEKDPFCYAIYSAYCASRGKMMYYNKPCVCSKLSDLSSDDLRGSIAYNKKRGNIYYFPQNRISEFKTYISCLNEIKMERNERIDICISLYERTLKYVTIDFRKIMSNQDICRHYHHKTEKISFFKMIRYALDFRKVFYEIDCKNLNKADKKIIEKKALKTVLIKLKKAI